MFFLEYFPVLGIDEILRQKFIIRQILKPTPLTLIRIINKFYISWGFGQLYQII
jgi:hypothetical protein